MFYQSVGQERGLLSEGPGGVPGEQRDQGEPAPDGSSPGTSGQEAIRAGGGLGGVGSFHGVEDGF